MPDVQSDPVELIKRAAVDAMNASNPVSVVFGTVISSVPLQVQVEQKLTLTEKQLVLCRNVTDYTVMMTVAHRTEEESGGSGENAFEAHDHAYSGMKTFWVHNALKSGEHVVLLRLQGGQKFLVIDRLGA